jgi:hypothetical protein
MKRTTAFIILAILTTVLINCRQINNQHNSTNESVIPTGNLIEIDFQSPNYSDLSLYAKDTITKDGWDIRYFVKDDSTRHNDIYLQCSKENLREIFYGEELLQFRRYFIPVFAGETNSYIFFTHGCATDCSAVLVFSKESAKFTDYQSVVDYNLELEQILYIMDSSYGYEEKIYELALVDLKNNKTHRISYNNICMDVFKQNCIDTVIFDKKQVIVKTTLQESFGCEKKISQMRIIKLK